MSKKRERSLDRLGHIMLKYTVATIAKDLSSGEPTDLMLQELHFISTIMKKAESKKDFNFTKKDQDEASVESICKLLDIDTTKFGYESEEEHEERSKKEEVDNIFKEVRTSAESIAKKFGIKNAEEIQEIKISDEQREELFEMIKKLRGDKK